MRMHTRMQLHDYYCLVRWLFLFPVLLPIVLLGRMRRAEPESEPESESEPEEVIAEIAIAPVPELDQSRYSSLHSGYWQDDGTLISDASLRFTWMGEYLFELQDGRLYNIIRAMDRGHWANGNDCRIESDIRWALQLEGKRRNVTADAEKHEARNRKFERVHGL